MARREVAQALRQRAVVERGVLGVAELGEDDGREARRLGAVPRDVARRRRVDAQRVEPVPVQRRLAGLARRRVHVLAHRVQVQLPDHLVGPGVVGEVEAQRVAAQRVPRRRALVARGRQQVLARRQRRQVLVVLHPRPRDEQVRVRGVDDVGRRRQVARQRRPVVDQVGAVPGLAQLVAQRHGHDVAVVLGPVRDVREAPVPVVDVEVDVAELR